MKYTEYKGIIENYWNITSRIVFDVKHWVWLDFRHKVVSWEEKPLYGVPATCEEYMAFIEYFLSKGRNKCTFKELQKYVNFHGVKIDDRKYYVTMCFNRIDFLALLQEQKKFSKLFVDNAKDARKFRKIQINDNKLSSTQPQLADMFIQFAEFLKTKK